MLKIMIVDDMEIVRRELKRMKLWGEETGFVISDEARNGDEALEKLEKTPFDLVITDIKMPKIDGIELLKKITEKKLCSCVILLSDYSEFSYARQGLVLGAFDYLIKPAAEDELKKVLGRAKAFIIDKQSDQQRMRLLEQSLGEKVEVYFPYIELNQLAELMKDRDIRTIEYAVYIADMVFSNMSNDLMKIESLLNGIIHELVNKMQESFKWLDKFVVSKHESELVKISRSGDLATLKAEFVLAIEEIIALLGRLQCGSQDNELVKQVCKCVLENIDGGVSLKTVSDRVFMNKTYISEAFKQKTGISFTEYLTVVKMERAQKLITDGRLKIYEVAEMLGFKDIEYFGKLFKRYTGTSPSEYRQSALKKNQ